MVAGSQDNSSLTPSPELLLMVVFLKIKPLNPVATHDNLCVAAFSPSPSCKELKCWSFYSAYLSPFKYFLKLFFLLWQCSIKSNHREHALQYIDPSGGLQCV